jgi:hypothetical protein
MELEGVASKLSALSVFAVSGVSSCRQMFTLRQRLLLLQGASVEPPPCR